MGVKTVEEMDKKEQLQLRQQQAATATAAATTANTTSSSSSSSSSISISSSSGSGSGSSVVSTYANKFPHFVFATEFTPEYHNSSWMSVHNQEDVLIRRNGHAPVGNLSYHHNTSSYLIATSYHHILSTYHITTNYHHILSMPNTHNGIALLRNHSPYITPLHHLLAAFLLCYTAFEITSHPLITHYPRF